MIRFLALVCCITAVSGLCYFPGELQGVWATQVAPLEDGKPIVYSMVEIKPSVISTWGECHFKLDDNIILADRNGGKVRHCYRCFRLVVASPNVAALLSSGLESCFATVEDALESCPRTERVAAHIVLYKVGIASGISEFQETHCPLNGVFIFSYDKGEKRHGRRNAIESCEQPTSEISNCPFGFSLHLQYRDCSFDRSEGTRWNCLGSWRGLDGQKYMAVWDISARNDTKPKYKCGIIKEDKRSGKIYLAFSRDSTCTNDLSSATEGYERYALTPTRPSPLPTSVRKSRCRFHGKYLGHWNNMEVWRSFIKLKDERTFRSFDMRCVTDMKKDGRYIVYSRSDCKETSYSCIMLKRRTRNIVELLEGKSQKHYDEHLCDDNKFGNFYGWMTFAKRKPIPDKCSLLGSYEGELPASPGYCAQIYTDCQRPNLIYFAIDECDNPKSVYEQRTYECLGEWTEPDGQIYALTHRLDIDTYECFVGVREGDSVVYIRESGSAFCVRDPKPKVLGMKAFMKSECYKDPWKRDLPAIEDTSLRPKLRSVSSPSPRPHWVPYTTKPWKPITGSPRTSHGNVSAVPTYLLYFVTIFYLTIL